MIDDLQENTERIRFLLTKRLTTGLTSQETQELERYCQKEPVLRLLIQRLDDKELTQKMVQRRRQAEKIAHSRVLSATTPYEPIVQQPSKKNIRWIGYSAAAALIVFAVVMGVLKISRHVRSDKDASIASMSAPHDSLHITLMLADGQSIILPDTNYFYKVAAHPGLIESLHYNILETPRHSQHGIILPDGSKVWLNTGSSLSFPTAFTGGRRYVELIRGEAYFEIAPDDQRPFSVKARDKVVDVLGTSFNIKIHPDETNISTTVAEGKVRVSDKADSVILVRDQQLTSGPDKIGQPEENIDVSKIIAWRQSDLTFDDSLTQVLTKLALRYNKKLQLDVHLEKLYFKGSIDPRKTLDEVLCYISHSQSIFKYQITGTTMIISRNIH